MVDMDTLVSLCKRRGFIFQSGEIYGGFNGFWDFGPLGVELKNNVKRNWWKKVVTEREDVVGIDSAIITHPQTWIASGHVESFNDPMVDCKKCKRRFRADDVKPGSPCPECGGELTPVREFNLMFQTYVGPVADSAALAYLRPETCQSIFTQFKQIQTVSRKKPPFGIAQIGKAFRNEITPRNFIFRSREFEQMEMEFFCNPAESQKWHEHWVEQRFNWFKSLGVKENKLRLRPHHQSELAHYASACVDIEYEMPFGWSEMEGIANRGDYDLNQHMKSSGKDLAYFNNVTGEKFVPAVVETSVGVDRSCLALLIDAYREEEVKGEKRVVMGFDPGIAPIQVAIFPLSGKLELSTRTLFKDLQKKFACEYDDAGSIGKRYRRHDEIGTPYCVTYDFQSEEDHAVTVRDRDSMQQERIAADKLIEYLEGKFSKK